MRESEKATSMATLACVPDKSFLLVLAALNTPFAC